MSPETRASMAAMLTAQPGPELDQAMYAYALDCVLDMEQEDEHGNVIGTVRDEYRRA